MSAERVAPAREAGRGRHNDTAVDRPWHGQEQFASAGPIIRSLVDGRATPASVPPPPPAPPRGCAKTSTRNALPSRAPTSAPHSARPRSPSCARAPAASSGRRPPRRPGSKLVGPRSRPRPSPRRRTRSSGGRPRARDRCRAPRQGRAGVVTSNSGWINGSSASTPPSPERLEAGSRTSSTFSSTAIDSAYSRCYRGRQPMRSATAAMVARVSSARRLPDRAAGRGRPGDRRGAAARAASPAEHAGDDRLGELRAAGGARGGRVGAHQQVRRGLSRAGATTGAARRWTSPSSWRSTAPLSCSGPSTSTSSPTPGRRPTTPPTWRCSSRATRSWGWPSTTAAISPTG